MGLIGPAWVTQTPLDSEVLSTWRTRDQIRFPRDLTFEFPTPSENLAPASNPRWIETQVFPEVEGPVHVSLVVGNAVVASTSVPASDSRARIEVAAKDLHAALGSIKINLVDADSGEPLVDANVAVHDVNRVSGWRLSTDANGAADFQKMFPGPVLLQVQASGYERLGFVTSVVTGESTEVKDVRISKARSLRGRIMTSSGRPVVRTRFECLSAEEIDGVDRGWVFPQFVTDDKGEFLVNRLGRRGYVLRILGKLSAYPVPISIEDIDRGVVSIALGAMVPVELELPDSLSKGSQVVIRCRQFGVVAELDATAGRFVEVELAMGTYEARLVSSGRVVRVQEFTAGELGTRLQLSK
jgi:hypothetical protein